MAVGHTAWRNALPSAIVASSVELVGAVGSVGQAAQCQREGTAGNKRKGLEGGGVLY